MIDSKNPYNITNDDEYLGESNQKIKYDKIYIGIVKDNVDFQRMGRLKVWIPDFGGDPNDENLWYLVSYLSPFAGVTNVYDNKEDGKLYTDSQISYGLWMIPPHIENQIAIFFANGEPSRGYFFAFPYATNMNHMVPGIASNFSYGVGWESKTEERCQPLNYEDTLINPPVVEYNKKDNSITDPNNNPRRPRFDPLFEGICAQGLYKDFERGPTNASARRDTPSQVFGFSTPKGHQLYIDDGAIEIDENLNPVMEQNEQKRKDNNGFIRLRTRSGAQILINDCSGYIYLNSRNGNSWTEISDDGINMYTSKDFNIRCQGNFNLRVDGNSNFEFIGNVNWRTVSDLTMLLESKVHIVNENVSGCGESNGIFISSEGDFNLTTTDDTTIYSDKNVTLFGCDSINTLSPRVNQLNRPITALRPKKLNPVIRFDRKLSKCCYPRIQIECGSILRQKHVVTHEPWGFHPNCNVSRIGDNDTTSSINACVDTPTNNTNFTNNIPVQPNDTPAEIVGNPEIKELTNELLQPTELANNDNSLADKIIRICKENFEEFKTSTTLFVKNVCFTLKVPLNGQANEILDYLKNSQGFKKVDKNTAHTNANNGHLVLCGLKGNLRKVPTRDGHICIITKGNMINDLPVGFWGGQNPQQLQPINLFWNDPVDISRIEYYSLELKDDYIGGNVEPVPSIYNPTIGDSV